MELTNEQLKIKKEHEKQLNRERVARYRAKQKVVKEKKTVEETNADMSSKNSSYHTLLNRLNSIAEQYGGVSSSVLSQAFTHAGLGLLNQPEIQNRRIKGISSLPADYTKEDIGAFLRLPYASEQPLRQTAEVLKWTAYHFYKTVKTYQDLPTYRYYVKPQYLSDGQAETKEFMREAILLDKLCKEFRPNVLAHEAVGNAGFLGKVAYTYRIKVDKAHNQVDYAFWQQLPSDWIKIIGNNNVSKWTVSFDLMYFLQPGTDIRSFGNLLTPYIKDFNEMFVEPAKAQGASKAVYASVPCKNGKINFYFNKVKNNAVGEPTVFRQDGRWFYWVSLPVDRVFVFDLDDTTANVASPFAGLFLTYSQQGDYENAQLSLLLNPLIKIFTGEIPYFTDNGSTVEDGYRLSNGGRMLFEAYFADLMARNNTGGSALFSAPLQNIKSHDFGESTNANDISKSFIQYSTAKSGLAGLIPVGDEVKASQVDASKTIESRFATATIYPQVKRLMNTIINSLNLHYAWEFEMFGDVFTEREMRENARKDLDKGDFSAFMRLCALDGDSWLDRISQLKMLGASGIMNLLQVPQTAYTQSGKQFGGEAKAGHPTNDGISSDAKEKAIDNGGAIDE